MVFRKSYRGLPVGEGEDEAEGSLSAHGTTSKTALQRSVVTRQDSDCSSRSESHQATQKYWTTIWLQTATLLGFIVLFIALAIGVVVLWRVNTSENGFRTTLGTNHYAWTYGPTAILLVVLSLWRQIDFYCKILQPWRELQRGPQHAESSISLDYVAPFNVLSFWRAVRAGHHSVIASITGFALLKVLILLSTGLLVLAPTYLEATYSAVLTTEFGPGHLWEALGDDPSNWRAYLSSTAVDSYLGLLRGEVKELNGIQQGKVFQSYNLAATNQTESGFTPMIVAAEVQVFSPNVTCDIAHVVRLPPGPFIYSPDSEHGAGVPTIKSSRNVQLLTSTCSSELVNLDRQPYCIGMTSCPPLTETVPWFVESNCSQAGEFKAHFALIASNVSFDAMSDSPFSNTTHLNMTLHETTAVICTLDYSMGKANLSTNLGSNDLSIGKLVPTGHLENLTSPKLSHLLAQNLQANPVLDAKYSPCPDGIVPNGTDQSFCQMDAIWFLLRESLGANKSMERFLNASLLQESSEHAWNGLATQFMRANYLQPHTTPTLATGTYVEQRLHVGTIAVWIMFSGFVLLIGCAVYVLNSRACNVVPHDPRSISTMAVVFAASPVLHRLLRRAGPLRTSQVATLLSAHQFQSMDGGVFRIEADRNNSAYKSTPEKRLKLKENAWIPISARYSVLAPSLGVPLVIIVVLESLDRLSIRNQGIASASKTETTTTYLSQYLSTLVIFLVATAFGSLDFTVASFAPYSLMRRGGVPASRSIDFDIVGSIAPVALWKALSRRHFASVFSNLAALIGSVLAIVVSGLWLVNRTVVEDIPVRASLAHSWNVDYNSSTISGDGGAGVELGKVLRGISSINFPRWDSFVLPSMDTALGLNSASDSYNYTFVLDALRPDLSCEVIVDDNIAIKKHETQSASAPRWFSVNATVPLSKSCQDYLGDNGPNRTLASSPIDIQDSSGYFSSLQDLGWAPGGTNSTRDPPGAGQADGDEHVNGCPSLGIILAQVSNATIAPANVTAFVCYQRVEKAAFAITYVASQTKTPSLSKGSEPNLVPGSSHYIQNGNSGLNTFYYPFESFLDANLTIPPSERSDFNPGQFWGQIVYGPNSTSLDHLFGAANRQNAIEAMKPLYTEYMQLVIDMKFRQPPLPNENLAVTGVAKIFESRLQVEPGSKLVLQIMLGVMVLFGGLGFWLSDIRTTLPRKPTSIASVMGFLAESELCGGGREKALIPQGAAWMEKREVERVFEGWLFGLGWWEQGREGGEVSGENGGEVMERRFGIDVGGPKELGFRKRRRW